jgi:hypothetical protein
MASEQPEPTGRLDAQASGVAVAAQPPSPAGNSTSGEPGFIGTPFTPLRIGIAVVGAALLGWVVNTAVGLPYAIPTELLGVDMYSPAAMQKQLAASEQEIYWKNGLIYFVILGIGFALAPLLMVLGSGAGRPWAAAGSGIVAGAVFGGLAFFATAGLRDWLNTGVELPLLGHAGESMVGDIIVFALAGSLVTLPMVVAMLMLGLPGAVPRAVTLPLAAIVAGLLFPIAASFLMPEQSTKNFPPVGPAMLALWLALLAALIILFMTTTGDKQRGKSSRDEVQPVA